MTYLELATKMVEEIYCLDADEAIKTLAAHLERVWPVPSVEPSEEEILRDVDPGIVDLVKFLRARGIQTTDSGDGRTKVGQIADGDALDVPHVHTLSTMASMIDDADLIGSIVRAYVHETGDQRFARGDVQAIYSAADGVVTVSVFGEHVPTGFVLDSHVPIALTMSPLPAFPESAPGMVPHPGLEHCDVFTLEEFIELMKTGSIVSSDGSAYYGTATLMSKIPVSMSGVLSASPEELAGFTHVIWFGK